MNQRGRGHGGLSPPQARRCEEAAGAICRCRCGGDLHGIRMRQREPTPRRKRWKQPLLFEEMT